MSDSKNSLDVGVEGGSVEKRATSTSVESVDAHYDPKFVERTLRKIDWRMLPLLGILYSLALIDRTNLGVARVVGMDKALGLSIGERYSIASMVYFPPYIVLEIPGNLLLQKVGARAWLTICIFGWGVSQIGMAFVPTWGLLCLTRGLLGAFEAGFFPALAFIIATWYKRLEVQKRLAAFYLIAVFIGGFSPVLAYGIQLLNGKAGLGGWQWIFLLEGIFTTLLSVFTWFFIVDFPLKNRFLTKEETQMVLDRVNADRGDSLPDPVNFQKVLKHLSDPITWSFGLMFMCATMPAYAVSFFVTLLLTAMGFNLEKALLLTAPPFVAAAISIYFFAWLSDKTGKRALWLAVQTLMTITGLMITAYAKPNGVRYFGIFLVNMGATGNVPAVLAYSANNVVSHSKRAVSTGLVVAFGGVGGIFATLVFREVDLPRYIPGIWATMACQFLLLILLAVNTLVFSRRNKLAREGKRVNEGVPGFYHTL